jgi:hypothetical protein
LVTNFSIRANTCSLLRGMKAATSTSQGSRTQCA